jgi:SNF family Na+-dependent transporter
MIDLYIKAFGGTVAAVLFAYALAIAYSARLDEVSNWYATGFSTVALIVFLAVVGGISPPPGNLVLETMAYVVAIGGGSAAFRRITRRPGRFEDA